MRIPIILFSLFLLLAGIASAVPTSTSAGVTPAATPDFAMSASPSNLTITAGSMGFSTVSVTSLNGFAGNVTLSTSAPPVGFGVGISPFILTLRGNGTAQAHVNVNNSFNGTTTWFLKVIGSSGSLSHSTTIQINGKPFIAPTFTISAANPFVVAQGFSNSTTVVVSSQHNFNGTVSLTASVFPNVSGGPTLTLSPTQVTVPPGGSGTSTLTVSTSLATPIGFYNYTLTGTAPEGGGFLTAQFSGALTVEASTLSEFTISANPSSQNVPAGANATSTILLTSVNGFSGTISLSTSAPPLCASCPNWRVIPAQVGLPSGGRANATLVFFTVLGSPPNTYTVTVTGASGGVSHSVNVAFTIVSSKPDFSISANPTTVVLPTGGKGNSTITLTSLNGFNGTVMLHTSPSPLCPTPGCTVWSITPTSVNLRPGGTAFATLNIVGGSAGSSGNITVTGTSGSLTHSVNVLFKISQSQPPDFSISAVPANLTITQGSSATSTITLTSLNGFNGTVTLTDTVSSNMITATLSRSSVLLPPGGSASVTLTVSTSNSTTPGNYSVTVTGASGTSSHTVQVGVLVKSRTTGDFSISANRSSLTIQRGSSGKSTLTIASLNGFAGTVSMFSMASPSGLSMSLNPANVTLQSGGSANSILTVFTTNGTGLGTYKVTVTGFSGNLSRSVTLTVTVVTSQQSFTLSVNPTHLTIVQGSAGASTVTVGSVNGFSGTVTLTAVSNSPNLSASISPTTIAGNGTATVTVVGSAAGNYTVAVTGNCCNMTRSATFLVTVTSPPPPPDFAITISPTNQTIHRGSTATYTITVRGTNGFNGTVTLSATISPVNRHGPTLSLPSTVGPYSTSTLTVSTGHNTPQQLYTITVKATSGSLVHTFTITLNVAA